jgi:catechol 2,3-dioxygenase-like lactoylglutathione lyase family enzyme
VRTYLQAKGMAKALRAALAARNIALTHGECLELVAQQVGFRDWNVLSAKIELETAASEPQPPRTGIDIQRPIPVLRVASRREAREFYVEFLGFEFDWGDEPGEERDFYAQVSRSGAQLHVTSESIGTGDSVSDAYFRMRGIDALQRELSARAKGAMPALRDTYYDARELAFIDPRGNRLRFVETNPPGVAARMEK